MNGSRPVSTRRQSSCSTTRAVAIHPQLRNLGSDTAKAGFDIDAALAALRLPQRANAQIGDVLLDQSAVAGLGNVYRSELPFLERISPFAPLASLSDEKLRALLERGERLVKLNSRGGARVTTTSGIPSDTYVYDRTGRPCFRCRTPIKSTVTKANAGFAAEARLLAPNRPAWR